MLLSMKIFCYPFLNPGNQCLATAHSVGYFVLIEEHFGFGLRPQTRENAKLLTVVLGTSKRS